jgi:hypothetical protein
MAQTVTLTQSAYKDLLTRLTNLERMVSNLVHQIDVEPKYGSDEWWEWSDKRAMEDIKKGNTIAFDSAKEMVEYLDSLK